MLLGILKPGKARDDPESYRLVGLECCLLKCLTLLVDMRIRAWAETNDILPDSQNGFRENYRTHNNSFILRCAIDQARSKKKPLYVAFIDLKNAFPATDLPTLWMKLYAAGVSGPLFDWLRMLYARMSYVVKQGSELSAAFRSLIGVLTGDTASPILWNVYFADLAKVFGPDHDDLLIAGMPVSHLEQADDVVLFSTTAAGLQRKIDAFFGWCRVNFMVVSISKTEWMLFGEMPAILPTMRVGDTAIRLVKEYKYVGVTITSTERDIFSLHYSKKASKARAVANTTFAAKSSIGCLPPPDGIRLYTSRIDPHLTFGCEVCPDTSLALRELLESVQHEFLRRLLGLHRRSMLAILFSETGVLPVRYRRILLAVSYMQYLLSLPPKHLANAALRDAIALTRAGHPSWLSDVRIVLQQLPVPVELRPSQLSADGLEALKQVIRNSCKQWISERLATMADRLPLIQDRLQQEGDGSLIPSPMKLRMYLRVPVPAHRKALTRVVLSAHTLGVELLRHAERDRPPVPRYARLCRLCRRAVETEVHALLECPNPELAVLKRGLLRDVTALLPDMPRQWPAAERLVRYLLQSEDLDCIQRLAKHAFEVLAVYSAYPLFRPAAYAYSVLQ